MTPSFESIFNRRQQAAFMRVCNAKLSCQSNLQPIRLLRVDSCLSLSIKRWCCLAIFVSQKRRLCKNRKRNSLFVSFTPAVSKVAMKSMRLKIRNMRVRIRTEMSIEQLAKWLNPIISGWIAYYGRYYRSALYGMCGT